MTNFKLVLKAVSELNAFTANRYEVIAHVDPLTQERVLSTATYEDETQQVLVSGAVEYFRCDTNEEAIAKLSEVSNAVNTFNKVTKNEVPAVEEKVEVVEEEKPAKPATKKELFAQGMVSGNITTRKDAISYAVHVMGMSKAGASTYWANYNKK